MDQVCEGSCQKMLSLYLKCFSFDRKGKIRVCYLLIKVWKEGRKEGKEEGRKGEGKYAKMLAEVHSEQWEYR